MMRRGSLVVLLACLVVVGLSEVELMRHRVPFRNNEDSLRHALLRPRDSPTVPPLENRDDVLEKSRLEILHKDPHEDIRGIGSYKIEVTGILGGSLVFPFYGSMSRFVLSRNSTIDTDKDHRQGEHHHHPRHRHESHNQRPHHNSNAELAAVRPPRRTRHSDKSYNRVNLSIVLPQPHSTIQLDIYAFRNDTNIDTFAVANMTGVIDECFPIHMTSQENNYSCHMVHLPHDLQSCTSEDHSDEGVLHVRQCEYDLADDHVKMNFTYCRQPSGDLLWVRIRKMKNERLMFYVHASVMKQLPTPDGKDMTDFDTPSECFKKDPLDQNPIGSPEGIAKLVDEKVRARIKEEGLQPGQLEAMHLLKDLIEFI